MREEHEMAGMLNPYRVLDLTDEKGLLCGKLLGDLGADVIKIERPGGDPARMIGPFYQDEVDPEKSLFWWAFNTSKRGITLDIETTDGQETFKKLVRSADFVIESFPPGYLDKLGLGYRDLEKLNPGIILVSITPFGQTGPYRNYKAPDIVAMATSGVMYQYGDADRPPVRISHHSQAYLHAGAEAAVGALMALHHREKTGEGQQVDVSIQKSLAPASYWITAGWDMMKAEQRRGEISGFGSSRMPRMWPCKDGYLIWMFSSGTNAKRFNSPLIEWMDSEEMGDDFLKAFNAETFDVRTATQEMIDRLVEPIHRFFMAHTKVELLQGAVKHRLQLFPASTVADILASVQLAAREFWVQIVHPELRTAITYPGAFVKASEAPARVLRRAPLIGEHNKEILHEAAIVGKELILSPARGGAARPDTIGNLPRRPLEGITVVDFGWVIVGPLSTKILSDYGAEVIKIESEIRPDMLRLVGPFKDGTAGLNRSGQFNHDNTGKLSINLNAASPRGIEVAKRLVARADVVVENFAGGAMERMGLGYQELKKVKPDIIMLSSCMLGQTGPQATQPGTGHQLTALSGFCHLTGWPDREPLWISSYTDYIAPHFNVLAILAALDYRDRTGKGQYLDASQYENGIHFLAPLILDYVVNGRVANRMGNRHPYAAPHNAYLCLGKDRWCAIAIFTDEEWKSFAGVIGNPSWTSDPNFATIVARKENENQLDRLIGEWTIHHSAEEVMEVMQSAGIGAGVLETAEDLLEHDPQLKYQHFFQQFDNPVVGKHYAPQPSFLLSKSGFELRRAPLLGEHTEYILKELLRMPDEEIAELVIEGVIK